MPLQFDHDPYKLLIVGKSGTGKTTYFLRALLGLKARCRFVFDHKGELAAKLGCRPALTIPDLAAAVPRGWVVFQPWAMFKGRAAAGFAFFCDWAYEVAGFMPGRKIVAVDELQQFISAHQVDPEFGAVVEDGRIRGLDLVAISSAPNLIHNRVRGNMTEVAAFLTDEARPLEWLQARGFDPAILARLPRGHYVCRNEKGGQVAGRVF